MYSVFYPSNLSHYFFSLILLLVISVFDDYLLVVFALGASRKPHGKVLSNGVNKFLFVSELIFGKSEKCAKPLL